MTLLAPEQRNLSLDDFTNPGQRPQLLSDALQHDKNLGTLIAQLDRGGVLLTLITDSSGDYKQFNPLFTQHIQPLVGALGYVVNEAENLLEEAYANAILHGNKASWIPEYERRGLPVPEHLDENKSKEITIEYVVCSAFYVLRVTDEGEGFDTSDPTIVSHITNAVTKGQAGLGLHMISRLSHFFYHTPPGNQITMVVYHPSAQPEVQAKEVHTTCTTL